MKIKVDTSELVGLEIDLGRLYKAAIPYADVDAKNRIARDLKNNWQGEMRSKFTLRNTFTERSLRVVKASMQNPVATVGSISPYLDKQEDGGQIRSKGRWGKPVPTAAARIGEDPSRLISSPYKLKNVRLPKRAHRARRGGRGAANRAAVVAAAQAGGRNRFAFLDLGRRKGIFRVRGRATKRRGTYALQVRMIADLSNRTIRIPAHPTLQPAISTSVSRGGEMYRRALVAQIERQRLFKRR